MDHLQLTSPNTGGLKTKENLGKIKEKLEQKWGILNNEKEIWRSLKNIEQPQIADFIWKMIHNRIKCGAFFRFILQWSDKEFCRCGATESIGHILTKCRVNGQKNLWKLIGKRWEKETKSKFKRSDMIDIMAIGSIRTKTGKMKEKRSADLYRTLVTTASWTIWKNRNRRILDEILEDGALQIKTWTKYITEEIKQEALMREMHKKKKMAKDKFEEKMDVKEKDS